MTDTFLTVEQAAGRLHIAPYTLREWIKRGKVRSFKPGRAWLIPEKALEELVANSTWGDERNQELSDDFIAKLEASAGRIEAGTLRPITSDDISKAIADARP